MAKTIRSRAWGDCWMEGTGRERSMTWQWLAAWRKEEEEEATG
jgi:hypothetical protein